MNTNKNIIVRPTRPGERFTDKDQFIAWFEGDASGTMAETEEAAIAKLKSFYDHPNKL